MTIHCRHSSFISIEDKLVGGILYVVILIYVLLT